MRKSLTALAAATTITAAAVATPTTADARWRGGWGGPALGGFALGAIVGSAFARPYYAYPYFGYGYGYPAYSYGYAYPAYSYGYPAYYGYGERERKAWTGRLAARFRTIQVYPKDSPATLGEHRRQKLIDGIIAFGGGFPWL